MIDSGKLTRWYDFQAPFYSWWRDDYGSPLVEGAARMLGDAALPQRILDAGCGTGMFSIGLALSRPRWELEGLDISSGMLAVAKRQAEKLRLGNVAFIRGDVTALPLPDEVLDGVTAAGLFPNINHTGRTLEELYRVLRPSGRLVVIEFDNTAMTAATRLFFNVMILGYKAISGVAPGFRFADRWNLRTSTIDRETFERHCNAAGFEGVRVVSCKDHLIFGLAKA